MNDMNRCFTEYHHVGMYSISGIAVTTGESRTLTLKSIMLYEKNNGSLPSADELVVSFGISLNQAEKDIREYRTISKFALMTDINIDRVSCGDDPPDFLIDGLVGVEVTTYHQDSVGELRPIAVENAWCKLRQHLAKELANHPVLQNIEARLSFAKQDVPTKPNEVSAFVTEFFAIFNNTLTSIGQRRMTIHVDGRKYACLAAYVTKIEVWNRGMPLIVPFRWGNEDGDTTDQEITKALTKKTSAQRPSCINAYWLVVDSTQMELDLDPVSILT
ncbi:MAG: hypothetical protein O3A46_15480, partial [Candidatus Poribacteria bacterium]|nr:hypothetical protein [Candidatus Poribacteria bacterium]